MARRNRKARKNGSEWVAFGLIFLVALGFVWLAVNYPVMPAPALPSGAQSPYFSAGDEWREQNVLEVDGTVITIGRGCTAIIAETSVERAEAIEDGLANKTVERPSAWDGWAAMLKTFDITFEATMIYGRSGDAYLSRAIFRTGNEILDLDMRPSDAIALALRTGTPIYLNMTLLREVGENIC